MNHAAPASPAPPTLRDATPADAARLAAFAARTFRETFAADNTAADMQSHLDASFSPAIQRLEIQDPSIDTLILVDADDRWLGFAQLRAGSSAPGTPPAGSLELWRFYVDRPWHGKGVAGALMDGAKRRAARRGAASLWLGVWERNARAQAFYRKHGFEAVGRKTFVVGNDPQSDDVMLCRLA
ncbi:MAG TPA: GNAT family N-acetyltransferase [Steroidobacteraceae bacterium]|nr:GNAT family N-acetyltransferase [Steroidobacteraceae bacterium]